MRLKALPVLTPATALALPPVLLAFATALAEAEQELPRQLFTVWSVATAAEKASAVPELCASAAASVATKHNETWNLSIQRAACVSCSGSCAGKQPSGLIEG